MKCVLAKLSLTPFLSLWGESSMQLQRLVRMKYSATLGQCMPFHRCHSIATADGAFNILKGKLGKFSSAFMGQPKLDFVRNFMSGKQMR